MNLLDFFRDPVLRAPTIGSMLMCLAAALVGVIAFVRKRSLLGEALSHATYPGVTGAIVLAGLLSLDRSLPILILLGAAFSALIGFFLIEWMEQKLKVTDDAALCFVLAFFFGIGITIASYAQNQYTTLFRQIQTYLYGQAATMTDQHVIIYGGLTLLVILTISLFYKQIVAFSFDRTFAHATTLFPRLIHILFIFLVVLAVVIGIRSVGVILMSAMLIAPAAAARQFTHRLSHMFMLSGGFGVLSGFLGVYLSVLFPAAPTGPMIVLVAGVFALYALLLAPKRGLLIRYWRVGRFRRSQTQENFLKLMWHRTQKGEERFNFSSLKGQGFSKCRLLQMLIRLRARGFIRKDNMDYILTKRGAQKGRQIVRLHRLWEVYLVNSLGLGVERVHKSAEEMEHILTPALERKLTALLDNPTKDPHEQPIPPYEEAAT